MAAMSAGVMAKLNGYMKYRNNAIMPQHHGAVQHESFVFIRRRWRHGGGFGGKRHQRAWRGAGVSSIVVRQRQSFSLRNCGGE